MNDETSEVTEELWKRKDFINDWYENKFLPVYETPEQVEKGRQLLQRWMPNDKAECEKIMWEIVEWVLAKNRENKFLKERKQFVKPCPNVYSFFSDQRFRDKLKSRGDYPVDRDAEPLAKPVCSKCKMDAAVKRNEQWWCAWHYSKEFCNEGPTGLNRLRSAWKAKPEPKLKDETPYQYFIRVCGSKSSKPIEIS